MTHVDLDPAERPDVIVVGAGVTGAEAAWRLARVGVATLVVTTSLDTIATLPRDGWAFEPPADGLLATLAAEACRDGRWSSRALRRGAKRALEQEPALHLLQATVVELLRDPSGRVVGVGTWEGVERRAPCVALCVGSFLEARLRVGASEQRAGRLSELADDALAAQLRTLGVPFAPRRLALDGDDAVPAYRVDHAVVDPAGLTASGELVALPGAYAFGLCAGGPADVAASAAAGAEAAHVLAALRRTG